MQLHFYMQKLTELKSSNSMYFSTILLLQYGKIEEQVK